MDLILFTAGISLKFTRKPTKSRNILEIGDASGSESRQRGLHIQTWQMLMYHSDNRSSGEILSRPT